MRSMNAISASPPPAPSVVWNRNKSIGVPSRDSLCDEIGRSPITLISRNSGLVTTTPPAGVTCPAGLLLERPRRATVVAPRVGGKCVRIGRETGVGVVAGRPELTRTGGMRASTTLLGDSRCGKDARAALVGHVEPVFVADTPERIPGIPVFGRRWRFGLFPFRFLTRSLPRRGFPGTLLRLCLRHLGFRPGLWRGPDPQVQSAAESHGRVADCITE